MKLLILLSSVLIIEARNLIPSSCNGVVINEIYHDKTVLTSGLDRPYLLTVDYDTDTLYFSYNTDSTHYESARINLRTKEMKVLKGIPNGFSSAIDREHKVIYVGTTDGIYAYNYETEESSFFGAKGVFIWSLQYKDDNLYYTVYPTQELYLFTNGESIRVKELQNSRVHNYLLDNDGDMTFDNSSGLFTLKNGQQQAQRYNKSFYILDMRTITLDRHNNMYVCFDDGVYSVNKNNMHLTKVLDIYDAFGLTFDKNNNIIYSDGSKIVQLKPNKNCSF